MATAHEVAALHSPAGLMGLSVQGFSFAPHVREMNRLALRIAEGDLAGLILELPVQHGKSTFMSHHFPAWLLGTRPDRMVGLASYNDSFASTWGRKVRNTLDEFGSLYGVSVAPDSSAAGRWDVYRDGKPAGGGMFTTGVGGSFIGRGFDLVVVDDPFKSWKEASSRHQRDIVDEWFRTGVVTRMRPGGCIVLIMSRWHRDDLAGRILARQESEGYGGRRFEVLRLPALAEERDPLGRAEGEALFPQRYPADMLRSIRDTIGSRAFAAQYQQRPMEAEGGLFRRSDCVTYEDGGDCYRLEGASVPKANCWTMVTVDPTASSAATADYFSAILWAVTPDNRLLLLDRIHERVEGASQKSIILEFYRRHRPGVLCVESASMGKVLCQELRNMGLPVIELKADRDKVTRAQAATARWEAHTIHVRPHLDDGFVDELCEFPTGEHDDQVDCLSYAVNTMVEAASRKVARVTEIGHVRISDY